MVINSLIDFCFDGGESGTRWVKNIKANVICLNKHQINDAVAYLLSNCYLTVGPNIFCQIIGIPMASDSTFCQLILIFL